MARLRFSADDDAGFRAAKEALLAEFEPWSDEHWGESNGGLAADVGTFLDWRWDYSNGVLDSYRVDDVDEFLLVWCPAKMAMPPAAAVGLCRALQAFVEFMMDTGRLQGGAASAARLMAHLDDLVPAAYEAMGDESKFGFGKSLFADTGFDEPPETAEQLQRMMAERMEAFNALPFEERKAMTDRMFTPEPIDLPFVYVPPSPGEIEAGASAVPVSRVFETLREYLGETGCRLTDKGNLKLADARELVSLLNTGDEIDPEIHGQVFTTRSSEQLRRLTFLLDWARESGAVRRDRGRLVPVKRWSTLHVVERAERIYATMIELGPVRSQRSNFGGYGEYHELLEDGISFWLAPLLADGEEREIDEVVELARSATRERLEYEEDDWLIDSLEQSVHEDVGLIFEMLELAGVVAWGGWRPEHDEYGSRDHRLGGTVRLTPLGRHLLSPRMEEAGFRLRSVPQLGSATAAELLDVLSTTDLEVDQAVDRWRITDPPDERARLVVEAIVESTRAPERMTGFSVLGALGADVAAPHVRQLLDSHASGHAALFLLDHGVASDKQVGMFLDLGPLVDILSTLLDEPDELCRLFTEASDDLDPDDTIEALWRHDQPETLPVLETLGRSLPDRRLAKAARKAAMKHRSWLANQR